MMKRDGFLQSIWQTENERAPIDRPISSGEIFDVAIIGAGITGLSTALNLQERGFSCIVLEANSIGFGTTGGTTAHLNTFFDTPFNTVEKKFSEAKAKLLYQAAVDSLDLIKKNIEKYHIDCDFGEREAYLFSVKEEQNKMLEDIIEGGKKVGLDINYTNRNPFNIPYFKIAAVKGQAQFNPAKYIYGLADAFEAAGGILMENSRVTAIQEEEDLEIKTSQKNFNAKVAIYATHIPPGVNLLHFRCAPYRSYAIAVKLRDDKSYPECLGYDLDDPYHYYRTQEVNGEKYLIAGGEDHKTGHEQNTMNPLKKLEAHVKNFFEVAEVSYKWSSQYFEPADGLPYIGKLPGHQGPIYVATGLGGNGMTYGTLTAIILSDIVAEGKSKYQDLFDPNRIKPVAGFKNFVTEGSDVIKKFITGKLSAKKIDELSDLSPEEASIIKIGDNKAAVYKDAHHQLHAVNPSCPHVNCTVEWNRAEKSWDCPCHGSRFSITGDLLTGPAQINLEQIMLTEEVEEKEKQQ